MPPPHTVPSHSEFIAACEAAFSFLQEYGFRRVDPPAHRSRNPFQVWFSKGPLDLVILGEGHGTMASVLFETADRRAGEIYFTPKDQRPSRKRRGPSLGQLELIEAAARRVQLHCADLLQGELERFDAVAGPLPPYLRPR
jgi:hypothetical protein